MTDKKISCRNMSTRLRKHATAIDSPEGRLWFAVINQAIMDLGAEKQNMLLRNARCFIASHRFGIICDYCGLDPTYAREQIARIDISQRPD